MGRIMGSLEPPEIPFLAEVLPFRFLSTILRVAECFPPLRPNLSSLAESQLAIENRLTITGAPT